MRRALISDIHGNLEALEVVLDDIKAQGITEIFCLGDIIGYGPNPRECIDRVMETCKVTLLGNHDQGAMFDPDGFNIGAERAIFWTREQLEARPIGTTMSGAGSSWASCPGRTAIGPFLFVHGSPRNPLSEYIFPEDIYNHRKMERLFQLVGRYCFQGHTHVPGIFTENFQFFAPEEIDQEYTLGRREADGQRRLGGPAARRRQPRLLRDPRGRSGRTTQPTEIRIGRHWFARRRSPTGVCLTISRPRSGRSTPFPSSNRSWAIGSDKDDRLVSS